MPKERKKKMISQRWRDLPPLLRGGAKKKQCLVARLRVGGRGCSFKRHEGERGVLVGT